MGRVGGMTTTATPLRPSAAYKAEARLRTPDAQARAAASLRAVLKERGHGSIEELRQALAVSRTTIRNWRPGGEWLPNPDIVRQIATAYAVAVTLPDLDTAAAPTAGRVLTSEQAELADELFDLFYSDNERAAATWLIVHNPAYFRCNTGVNAA